MDTCIHACIHLYMHIYIHAYMHDAYTHTCVHTYIHACIDTCIHTCTHIHACIFVALSAHIYTWIERCVCVCLRVYMAASNFYGTLRSEFWPGPVLGSLPQAERSAQEARLAPRAAAARPGFLKLPWVILLGKGVLSSIWL